MRRGIFLLLVVLAGLGATHTTSFDGALAGWESLAAKVATLPR
jgi:hypothetical protein